MDNTYLKYASKYAILNIHIDQIKNLLYIYLSRYLTLDTRAAHED